MAATSTAIKVGKFERERERERERDTGLAPALCSKKGGRDVGDDGEEPPKQSQRDEKRADFLPAPPRRQQKCAVIAPAPAPVRRNYEESEDASCVHAVSCLS